MCVNWIMWSCFLLGFFVFSPNFVPEFEQLLFAICLALKVTFKSWWVDFPALPPTPQMLGTLMQGALRREPSQLRRVVVRQGLAGLLYGTRDAGRRPLETEGRATFLGHDVMQGTSCP